MFLYRLQREAPDLGEAWKLGKVEADVENWWSPRTDNPTRASAHPLEC